MGSVSDNLRRSRELSQSDSGRLDLEVLLGHILQQPRSWLYTWPEYLLSEIEQQQFDALFRRRANGEPVAHLVGRREFWSLPLKVNNSTLIPRPDTEMLVEVALEMFPQKQLRLLDLGTGTGAIALALASERPGWQIIATDKSVAALALARENCQQLKLNNVRFLRSDWFADVPRLSFDLIVSNPPYIDAADPHLQQGDLRFEPHSALVAPERGLGDIKLIACQCKHFLSPQGWLMVEHGWQQATDVHQLFATVGLHQLSSRRDYCHHQRLTLGCFSAG